MFYPYVISKNTTISKDGCSGLVFILVPENKKNHVVGFIDGGTFSLNKMVLIPLKIDLNVSSLKITSWKDIIDEQNMPKGAKIFFSGEVNNKIIGHEYSYFCVSENIDKQQNKKIGFTPFGNFSLHP